MIIIDWVSSILIQLPEGTVQERKIGGRAAARFVYFLSAKVSRLSGTYGYIKVCYNFIMPTKKPNPFINSAQAAYLLNVTTPQLAALRTDPDNPLPEGKKDGRAILYDLRELHEWDVKRKIRAEFRGSRQIGEDVEKVVSFHEEKARLTKAQADEKELAVMERRGILIPISLVTERYQAFCNGVRAGVLSLPAEIGRACPEISASGMDVVRRVIARVLNGLAEQGRMGTEPGSEPVPGAGDSQST
jgi:phage terminase Nu1 subunit (DNA packaging protein)